MERRSLARLVWILCALMALAPAGARAQDQDLGAIRIHVRGSAQIQVAATTDGGALIIRGSLVDDVGSPIAAAPLSIQAVSTESPSTPLALPTGRQCQERRTGPLPRTSRDEYVVDTDERGEFCVRAEGSISSASIRVRPPMKSSKLLVSCENRRRR